MTAIPADLGYTTTHEWVLDNEDGTVTIGMTDHNQGRLGDIVFIELPQLDRNVTTEEVIANVRSDSTELDIHAPLDGKIIDVNPRLEEAPNLINESCFDEGWILQLELSDATQLDDLMTPNEYLIHIEQEQRD